jgi:hypothetical protein
LSEKLPAALTRWAIISMGEHMREYLDAALFNYLTLVIARLNEQPDVDLIRLLRETPFIIPRSPRRIGAFPDGVDILGFAKAYQKTLEEVRAARATLARGTSLRVRELTHQRILPGASPDQVRDYCSMPPTEVALDYVCWKFNVRRSGEALKKQLKRNLSPTRIRRLRDAASSEPNLLEALAAQLPVLPSPPSAPAPATD